MSQVNVLFVCTGNTCRSPMAEGLFRKASEGQDYQVSSAGVAAYDGTNASRETLAILKEKSAPIEGFQSRMVDEGIIEVASHVFCLTRGHLDILESLFPEYEEKFYLVTDFATINGQVGGDIADPIGMGMDAYDEVAGQLEVAIKGILGFLGTNGAEGKAAQE